MITYQGKTTDTSHAPTDFLFIFFLTSLLLSHTAVRKPSCRVLPTLLTASQASLFIPPPPFLPRCVRRVSNGCANRSAPAERNHPGPSPSLPAASRLPAARFRSVSFLTSCRTAGFPPPAPQPWPFWGRELKERSGQRHPAAPTRPPPAPLRPRSGPGAPPQSPVPPTAASPEPARFWGLRPCSPKRLSGPRGLLALIMRRDPSPPLRARRPPPLTRLLRQPPPGPVSRFRPAPPRPPPASPLVGGKPPPPADWFERVPITARTALGADWLAQTSPG